MNRKNRGGEGGFRACADRDITAPDGTTTIRRRPTSAIQTIHTPGRGPAEKGPPNQHAQPIDSYGPAKPARRVDWAAKIPSPPYLSTLSSRVETNED